MPIFAAMNSPATPNDEYLSLAGESQGFYSCLRSKFMAFAYPVKTEDDVRAHLSTLKRQYHDARHIAYAYILGADGARERANDDGEPSGTAGRPILGQLHRRGLSDAMVAVVRYFGGVKLGTSRLADAYKAAADDALEKAKVETKIVESALTISFAYAQTDTILRALREAGGRVVENGYENGAEPRAVMKIRIRKGAQADFLNRIERIAKTETIDEQQHND